MRTWPVLLVVTFLGACGGIALDQGPSPTPSTSSTASPPDAPTSSPTSSPTGPGTATGTPTPTPTPTGVPAPAPVVAGALLIEVIGETLGAPIGDSDRRSYLVDPASGDVTVTRVDTSALLALSPQERAKLDSLLAAITASPMPAFCAYDGPTAALRVSRSGTRTTYLAEDYNCQHRQDVSYAKGIGAALGFLDQVARGR